MTLETERLILRPWKEDDAESLYKYAKERYSMIRGHLQTRAVENVTTTWTGCNGLESGIRK